MFPRAFLVVESPAQNHGETPVRFRKIRIERERHPQRIGRPFIVLHTSERHPQQEMRARIVIQPLQRIERRA